MKYKWQSLPTSLWPGAIKQTLQISVYAFGNMKELLDEIGNWRMKNW